MKIVEMQVNHRNNPRGYDFKYQTFGWKYAEMKAEAPGIQSKRIQIAKDPEFQEICHDSGFQESISNIAYGLTMDCSPRTIYYWRVQVRGTDGSRVTSETAFFETGKLKEPWQGSWVGIPGEATKAAPILRRSFELKKNVARARLYVTGLGLYECFMNGNRVNDGYLQPGFHNYNNWIQYQTYDVTEYLQKNENVLAFLMGDGWYKGRFGVNGGFECNFGSDYRIICELHIQYQDGTEETIASDHKFRWQEGPISFGNIYDGEIYDAGKEQEGWQQPGFDDSNWLPVQEAAPTAGILSERYSVPVTVKEIIKPKLLKENKDGSVILDLGQNITGWLVFRDFLKKGSRIRIKHVEHMQDGEISTINLLTAKQEFIYTSDGSSRLVRPHFTYYGFRYVQIEGDFGELPTEAFEAWNLYSDLAAAGTLTTGNEKVNQFIKNVTWSQRDNFLDHPSDCPQRSERLGWTGDAQMYCGTAGMLMDIYPFFRKYMKDVWEEQKKKGGMVPFIIPKIEGRGFEKSEEDEVSAAWSDAAVIIPWTLYLYYGDTNLLREQYAGMKAWVEYMIAQDEKAGDKRLWQTGFHFGDWLALDNPKPGPFGKTDPYYIASCYYYYSTSLLAKAAGALGEEKDKNSYEVRAQEIKDAIQREYFDEQLICKIDTQTAYVLGIYMDLIPIEAQRLNGQRLEEKIRSCNTHLDTGFVGTPYLCPALSKVGKSSLAYELLLKEDYPSWLFQVNQGATTVWESWDALDEQGRLVGESSLNHYAFGSLVEWLYRDVCGLNPLECNPGFEKALIQPKTSAYLGSAQGILNTGKGTYRVSWKRNRNRVALEIQIPYGGGAILRLEDGSKDQELGPGIFCYDYEAGEV